MLADGSFDSIVQKWGLEESACLGQPGTDSVMKAEDTVKEKTGFLDNMLDILRQLLSGMLASLGIFVLTLIFSLIYFNYAWHTAYVTASCSIFRTVLSFRNVTF